ASRRGTRRVDPVYTAGLWLRSRSRAASPARFAPRGSVSIAERALESGAGLLPPRHGRQAVVDLFHRDAAVHGANQGAKIAAHTFFVNDSRNMNFQSLRVAFASVVGGSALDALMGAIFASDVAKLTADAKLRIDARDNF